MTPAPAREPYREAAAAPFTTSMLWMSSASRSTMQLLMITPSTM